MVVFMDITYWIIITLFAAGVILTTINFINGRNRAEYIQRLCAMFFVTMIALGSDAMVRSALTGASDAAITRVMWSALFLLVVSGGLFLLSLLVDDDA